MISVQGTVVGTGVVLPLYLSTGETYALTVPVFNQEQINTFTDMTNVDYPAQFGSGGVITPGQLIPEMVFYFTFSGAQVTVVPINPSYYPFSSMLLSALTAGNLSPVFENTQVTGGVSVGGNVSTLAGATAGTVVSTMPFQGEYKKFVAYANGYENDTTTAQSITFPVAFTNTPIVTQNTSGLTVSVSTTTLTITAPDATTTYSGYIFVEGS